MNEHKSPWSTSRAAQISIALAIIAVLAIAVTTATVLLRNGGGEKRPPDTVALTEGQPAPEFSLTDFTGRTVSLDDLRGRPVLLYFSMGSG